jgi:hypothetical protein
MKRMILIVGGILFASAASASQPAGPGWEQRVAATIPDADRARKVVEGRADAIAAVQAADQEMKGIFLRRTSSASDRRIAQQEFKDKRRKAAFGAIDALLEVRGLVSKDEWKKLRPESFLPPGGHALLARTVKDAIPGVVSNPVRRKQAESAAGALLKAAKKNESARRWQTGRLSSALSKYESTRDDFIMVVNDLDDAQAKLDDALEARAGELQRILAPDEWTALVGRVSPAVP